MEIPNVSAIIKVLQQTWPEITIDQIKKVIAEQPKKIGDALNVFFPQLGKVLQGLPQLNVDIDTTQVTTELQNAINKQNISLQSIITILLKFISIPKYESGTESVKYIVKVLRVFTTIAQSDNRLSELESQLKSSKNNF